MKLGEFLLIIIFLAAGAGLLMFSFNTYLFARSVGPSNSAIKVKPGEALSLEIPNTASTSTIEVKMCGPGGAGVSCLPLLVGTKKPVIVRVPIGSATGDATLQVSKLTSPVESQELYTINLTIQ